MINPCGGISPISLYNVQYFMFYGWGVQHFFFWVTTKAFGFWKKIGLFSSLNSRKNLAIFLD
jgi:hypothetical protein